MNISSPIALDKVRRKAVRPHKQRTHYWRDLGLDETYHTFADILQSNRFSPHQVLLDADIDSFRHPDAGHALARAAADYPEDPSTDDSFQCCL
jgi:hypothetical protein